MNRRYEEIICNGSRVKVASMKYDDKNVVKYMICSFETRQIADFVLTNMQKGCNLKVLSERNKNYYASGNYIAKVLRVKDENAGDGVHAIIYDEKDTILKIYNGDNKIDSVFDYIESNTKCGLLNEWKSFVYNKLMALGNIHECAGFDYTGKAPSVLVMNNVKTDLIRNIKSAGLKDGEIVLPVDEVEELSDSSTFLDIIENYIIPFLEEEKYHYNVGEEISDIFKTPILNSETKERYLLYPRQRVIAQGILNKIKDTHKTNNPIANVILNLGTGTGKTYLSAKLSYAILKEHLKKDSGRIAVFCPGHMQKKWIRQIKECLNPIGVYPNFYTINNYRDINNIPKEAKGIDVIILPKDRIKRSYLKEYCGTNNKFKNNNTFNFISNISGNDNAILFNNASSLKDSEMKLAARRLEKKLNQKIVLYKELFDSDDRVTGYKVVTTSESIKKAFGLCNKAYDFVVTDIEDVNQLAVALEDDIKLELEKIEKDYAKYYNPLICPCCGGAIYEKSDDIFNSDNHDRYIKIAPNTMTNDNIKCKNYIKADGTTLSEQERRNIIKNIINIKVVKSKCKNPYQDNEGNVLTEEELLSYKQKGFGYTILVMQCNHKLWGAKDQVGYRCVDSVKYYLKKFGENSIDVAIVDEFHQLSKLSNCGNSFGYLCKASKVCLPLSGSLTNGRASDLFYSLYRLYPKQMKDMGYSFNDISKFVDHFGRKKRVTKEYYGEKYNKTGNGKIVKGSWQEIPGISPILYNRVLRNVSVTRHQEDLGIPLPRLKSIKHGVEMDHELKNAYNNLRSQIVDFIAKNKDINVAGSYINALLSYPDMPVQEPIYAGDTDILIANPQKLDIENRLLNKEIKLMETIDSELAEKRRVLVYSVYSGTKGVSKRLMQILSKKYKVAELTSSIKLEKREEWIQNQYDNGVQVIVTNPKTVDTGLDIINYPTIYFYEQTFEIKVMRQAAARSRRPSSKFKECRVYYSYYKDTLQEDGIKLIASGISSAKNLEGIFSEDMLSNLADVGESPAAVLNKILQGKVKLKESDLDAFGFDNEETTYDFEDIDDNTVEVTKKVTYTSTISLDKKIANQLSIFEIDEEFLKNSKNKKKKARVGLGQLGFVFE